MGSNPTGDTKIKNMEKEFFKPTDGARIRILPQSPIYTRVYYLGKKYCKPDLNANKDLILDFASNIKMHSN